MLDTIYRLAIFAQTNIQPGGGADPGGPAPGGEGTAPVPPGGGGGGGGMFEPLILFGVMLLVFYLLIFRPQQKRTKKHKEFVEALKRGDNVITSSGIYGRVLNVEPDVVLLEVDKTTKLKILKSQIAGHQANPDQGGSDRDAKLVRDISQQQQK